MENDGEYTDGLTEVHFRRITLKDGRYLIFYTFPEPEPPEPANKKLSEENV
jgi:hypothetical protein